MSEDVFVAGDLIITGADPRVAAVRAALTSKKTLGAGIRDACAALQIDLRWHEADILAEAVGHHYDKMFEVVRILDQRWTSVESFRKTTEHEYQRRDLLDAIDKQGYALVEEPTETVHATPASYAAVLAAERDSGSIPRSHNMTDEQIAQFERGGRYQHCLIVVLTGRCRKLAKAR